ncbi:MAG: hypothetical protein M3P18_05345 [Actinomycetota bacterium]|nr:hypothetical protein [Actinomycetota bacterium]
MALRRSVALPIPDLRPGATDLPKPFPKTALVAKVRAQTENPDSFDTDEKSDYVSVHVPACTN